MQARKQFRLGRVPSLALALVLALVAVSSAQADETPMQRELRHRMEALQAHGRLTVGGVKVTAVWLMADLYAGSRFEPVFTDPKKIDELLRAITDIERDGLNPQDYYLDRLEKLRTEVQASPTIQNRVDLDILLTDALTRLAYNSFYGKVDPERIDRNINVAQPWRGKRGAEGVREYLASKSLYDKIESLKPTRPRYDRFRRALARYRQYENAGGWGRIKKGKVLSVGRTDPRVPAIRHRLAVTEDLAANLDDGSALYDADLENAVHRFQARHRLPPGDLGAKTIAAMNVPVKQRVDQIRVNLERARWFTRDILPTRVVINIAAFQIYFYKNGKQVWQNEAQVGKTYTQTPLIADEIEYLVLNPTWTVPPGVLEDSVLPAAKKDPSSITRRGLHVIDASGREVPAKSVNWKRYTASTFPYTLRQDPGPDNPLGRVKFIFPNRHSVYLHDTPNQAGYERRLRAMSWGCIHVQDPLELAAWMIDDPVWNLKAVEARVKSGKTKTIHLEPPVRVALFYWTFEVGEDGLAGFLPDTYQRDRRILRGLNGPFKLRKAHRRAEE
ncbi:MAG: L,D-transpeptidase family protein [Deltaproteobacteria bacterium]|nr:L,D-transpeptidase family protein [Deltaproteobacteria bacterium]